MQIYTMRIRNVKSTQIVSWVITSFGSYTLYDFANYEISKRQEETRNATTPSGIFRP